MEDLKTTIKQILFERDMFFPNSDVFFTEFRCPTDRAIILDFLEFLYEFYEYEGYEQEITRIRKKLNMEHHFISKAFIEVRSDKKIIFAVSTDINYILHLHCGDDEKTYTIPISDPKYASSPIIIGKISSEDYSWKKLENVHYGKYV